MKLSEISIKKPVMAWMMMLAIVLFGGISFFRLGVSELPDIDFPVISIHADYDGAAPEVMEADVIDIIEDAVMSVQGVQKVTSTAKSEQATVVVEFDIDRNIDLAMQDVQSRISQIQRRLPSGMDPPTVNKSNPEDQPIQWVTLSGDWDMRRLNSYARDHVKDSLQTVNGVAEVFLGGYLEPDLRVWVNPAKLAQFELTVQDLIDAIQREHEEIPAGRIETDTKETQLRYYGEASSIEDFANIVINSRGGQPVYADIRVQDVARVEAGLSDFRRTSRVNGKPAVGLGVKKQRGANAVAVAKAVGERVEAMKKELPPGLTLGFSFDATKFIREATGELQFNLIMSVILTALVCWIFLRSFAATLNILMAIPVSIIGTFLVMYSLGYTLNTFTLMGLVLSVGIVVDDAIMVLENITRHREMGASAIDAALQGTREISSAALAATLSLIAIFLPVIFMPGFMGKLFLQFGVTLSVAVAFSLFEALTFTPMRAAQFSGRADRQVVAVAAHEARSMMARLTTWYGRKLNACLHHPWLTLLAAGTVFGGSLIIMPLLPQEFIPAQDQGLILFRLKTPPGSSLTFTDSRVKQAESIITAESSVQRYFAATGGFGGGDVDTAMLFITLKPKSERRRDDKTGKSMTQKELVNYFSKAIGAIPHVKAFQMDMSLRGFTAQRGFPIEFSIRGPDWEKLITISEDILVDLRQDKAFRDVDTNFIQGIPEIRIVPDREKARQRGVAISDIGEVMQVLYGGMDIGKFSEGGRRVDIRVRFADADRVDMKALSSLGVRNYRGELVPLLDVVNLSDHTTVQSITREQRERAIGLSANISEGHSQDEAMQRVLELASQKIPEGYRLVWTGSSQAFKESGASGGTAFLLGLVIAFMILAAQYNSLRDPVAVMVALPFSLTGALLGLYLAHQSLNLYSFIGIILLMGIVKKNAILLVDFTRQRRESGDNVMTALMQACPQRLRPILMTSVTTLVSAIPPALALGPGSETRIPMSVVILGGVTVSTLLTLFVVPCVYKLLARKGALVSA